ncbi:hypothetical protein CVIRNUC_001123 [Coccomyxa viridis]|uniref:Spatacsin C-terminal domain-containing protein n=1 Tax=Coccomyxa viridis TaxID=1274662 RepID=A0AAV1HTR0_9CHLO|nr:hypothetical protein CVIRNUC_001123 [Coccomyxa viridis]
MSGAKSSLHQVEDSLRHSKALQALQAHLSDTQLTDGGSFKAELSAEQRESIAARARHLAVRSFEHPQIVAACVTLTALCNRSVWPLCIDVAAQSSLHTGNHNSKDAVRKLTEDFASADHQVCGLSSAVAEVPQQAPRRRAEYHADRRCKCSSAEAVAQALADSIVAAERAAVRHPGLSKKEASFQASRQWTLLLSFCEQHGLPCDGSRLVHLAASNEWIFFMAEASTCFLSLKQVIAIAAEHFTDSSLRHHILHVLTSQLPAAEQPALHAEAAATGGPSMELFEVLNVAAQESSLQRGLLNRAAKLRWPVLAVLAACQPEASAAACMTVWLQATIAVEGGDSKQEGEALPEWREASLMIQEACRRGAYSAAADAVAMFMPSCPLVKCIRMVEAASQGRFAEMLAQQAELTAAMTPPPARRPGSFGEGETEAEWVMKVAWAIADGLLAALPSWTERVPILERLVTIDLPVPGGSGAEEYRDVLMLYELLEGKADAFIRWPGAAATQQAHCRVDKSAALQALVESQKWDKASRWAAATSQEQHSVTLARGDALLADWQRLMWLPRQRHQAWADIQQLFTVQQLPPISAAHFLVSAAERLAGEGMLELAEQVLLVQDASCWLGKAKLPEQAQERRAGLLGEMARAVQLLSACATIQGSAVSVMQWKKAPLVAQWAPREDLSGSSIAAGAAADVSVSMGGLGQAEEPSAGVDGHVALQLCGSLGSLLSALVGQPSKAEITAALRSLLEHGDVAGARSLSRELPSPPIDLVLAEAAAALIQHCRPAVSQEAGKPVEEAVPAAVLSYLSHRGHEKLGSPLDVLDALEACAARGAARALCALAASSFRAATLLGMTCEEAASLGPRQSLQVLLMKGPQAAPLAIQYAAAYHLSTEETAEVLADSFLKGLLAAHHDTEGSISDAWSAANFRDACESLGSPEALGSALVHVLLERHGALPAAVECGLLLAAHACYEAASRADVLGVLVQLAGRAMQQWAQRGDWRPLVQLTAGMGQYKVLRGGLDMLVANDQLELLLSRRSGAHSSSGARLWRAAVMAAIQRQRPHDKEAWALAHHHFGCARETAASLQADAQVRAEADVQIRKAGLHESLAHLNAMSAAIAAARAYADADCCRAAVSAAQTAIELGQQLQGPRR